MEETTERHALKRESQLLAPVPPTRWGRDPAPEPPPLQPRHHHPVKSRPCSHSLPAGRRPLPACSPRAPGRSRSYRCLSPIPLSCARPGAATEGRSPSCPGASFSEVRREATIQFRPTTVPQTGSARERQPPCILPSFLEADNASVQDRDKCLTPNPLKEEMQPIPARQVGRKAAVV